ncbi:uncharacterized protein LOC113663619 isoform X3 [Tachysurus fulvidraco]|uniref:uncharacterized protein LOC113663619 isoform X3 n=1 Tax=Tachysurus fulvidraco TaxID=1234273 RepID=UPI000F512C94|nr:uncharacterized protein LOC113663619 isoform X3 [Tachysurus fulvidraco]
MLQHHQNHHHAPLPVLTGLLLYPFLQQYPSQVVAQMGILLKVGLQVGLQVGTRINPWSRSRRPVPLPHTQLYRQVQAVMKS